MSGRLHPSSSHYVLVALGWAHVVAGSNQGNSTTGSHRMLRNMEQHMCSPTHRTGWLLPKGRERNPGPLHDFRFVRIGKTVLYVGLPGLEPGTSSLSETKACVPAVHCCSKNAANLHFFFPRTSCVFTAVQARCRQRWVRQGDALADGEGRADQEPQARAVRNPRL